MHPPHTGTFKSNYVYHVSTVSMLANIRGIYNKLPYAFGQYQPDHWRKNDAKKTQNGGSEAK